MVDEGSDRAPGLLLDTNIVIAVLKQEDAALARLQEAVGSFFVSVITLGELRFGGRKSSRIEENLQRVENFAVESNILATGRRGRVPERASRQDHGARGLGKAGDAVSMTAFQHAAFGGLSARHLRPLEEVA